MRVSEEELEQAVQRAVDRAIRTTRHTELDERLANFDHLSKDEVKDWIDQADWAIAEVQRMRLEAASGDDDTAADAT